MGQKVNPIGFRLAVSKDWRSKWYAPEKEYADALHSDLAIRKYLKETYFEERAVKDKQAQPMQAAISKIVIERAWNQVRVTLHTARPGLVIGRKGEGIEVMSQKVSELCGGRQVKIDIFEIKQPELDAQLVAESVAVQLERRISFRRAMKRSVQTAMDMGADGIRIRVAGRLGGADIARAEQYRQGKVPLQTLRIPIDYGFAEARTVYGIIGVKVWLNRGNAPENSQPRGNDRRRERSDRGGDRGGQGRRGAGDRAPAAQASQAAEAVVEAAAE
ncbi:MAG TPA: 30S ribosomal protein S3 [Verrucomicrobiales bacterium]|nr:30S ribosomal protein S3 [Verrucomicrobiales bacterium]HCN79099.1 30S ribosomal protein S3 [Verrucomicrobiales bacterium]HRJ07460.1 30S ribosomal protein S3 [Prosthecobacter sp.]HRK13647.1 30S ribosomal protein S3 [Prosthecobacter sp.]